MENNVPKSIETIYENIWKETQKLGFTMFSDRNVCSFLRTMATTKPNSRFLELGTGTGLATVNILDGMQGDSTLVTVDNDTKLLAIAQKYLHEYKNLKIECADGEAWVNANMNQKFDYIFADTWHGKYLMLEPVLNMLNPGGMYIIDDMLPQENWPQGHAEKAKILIETLENRSDLNVTKFDWGSGVVMAVKK